MVLQLILEGRRTRLYSEAKFRQSTISNRLLVPLHIPVHLQLYFRYLITGLGEALKNEAPRGPSIYVGFSKHSLHVPRKSRFILVQHEQTHVCPPDPSDLEEIASFHNDPAIQEVIDGVRLHGSPESFERSNHIIEYSIANRNHILSSSLSGLYENKSHYIAPLIGHIGARRTTRKHCNVITMFGQPALGRRGKALELLRQSGINVANIRNFDDYASAFKDAAVLINLAQKSYLQTPEELRVLPALLEGLLVVTEENRFLDQLPYRDFLITSSMQSLPDTIRSVSRDYSQLWEKAFRSRQKPHEGFTQKMRQIQRKNLESFRHIAV